MIMLFNDWVVIDGKKLKEVIKLNKNLIILNGYIFPIEKVDNFQDDRMYMVVTDKDTLVVLLLYGEEVLRIKGMEFY